ncbi:unnamed protein product [Agarophyton chilense]
MSAPSTPSPQSLQKAYDEIEALEEKVNHSKRLFERECQIQSALIEDLAKKLAEKTKPIHIQMANSSSLINAVLDEDDLWGKATQMANLSHQVEDTEFKNALRETECIAETIVYHSVDKDKVINSIDDLIRTLQGI